MFSKKDSPYSMDDDDEFDMFEEQMNYLNEITA